LKSENGREAENGKVKMEKWNGEDKELKLAVVRIGISWGENSEHEFELCERTNITTPPPAVARDPAERRC
jgi:hypothetical protein